ncbi:MAG: hypothetical protein L6416_09880 [Candidatus Omnitrophica bacterium]|nr:hypothetical protein [Candidatus Omnitrophota bacterium]
MKKFRYKGFVLAVIMLALILMGKLKPQYYVSDCPAGAVSLKQTANKSKGCFMIEQAFAQSEKIPGFYIKEGDLIDLDLKDVDMKDVARMFSRVSGLNIVISEQVKSKVSISVSNANWEKALEMILKTYNLASIREENFLRILTYNELQMEDSTVPLISKVVFLNFANVENIKGSLDSMRSGRGKISVDIKTNSLIITDNAENIQKMIKVIEELDKRTPQVLIEGLMLDVKLTEDEQLGINLLLGDKDSLDDADSDNDKSAQQNLGSDRVEGIIKYGKTIYKNTELIALVDFWSQTQKAEVLANPKVMTLDGLTAKIELIEQVPYVQSTISTETGSITSTVSFKDVGIKLEVTPTISSDGFISLTIKTEQSFRTGTIENQPIIDSRKAETNLLVKSGETIIIGGLRKKSKTDTIDKTPILGDLPLIGKLFRKTVNSSTDTELLIFVTPFIINQVQLTPREQVNLEKFDPIRDERKNILDRNTETADSFPLRPLK